MQKVEKIWWRISSEVVVPVRVSSAARAAWRSSKRISWGKAWLATDRAAVADFQAFCRDTGHALVAQGEEAGGFSFTIRKRADDLFAPKP